MTFDIPETIKNSNESYAIMYRIYLKNFMNFKITDTIKTLDSKLGFNNENDKMFIEEPIQLMVGIGNGATNATYTLEIEDGVAKIPYTHPTTMPDDVQSPLRFLRNHLPMKMSKYSILNRCEDLNIYYLKYIDKIDSEYFDVYLLKPTVITECNYVNYSNVEKYKNITFEITADEIMARTYDHLGCKNKTNSINEISLFFSRTNNKVLREKRVMNGEVRGYTDYQNFIPCYRFTFQNLTYDQVKALGGKIKFILTIK